jgi:hypothetical protein
MIPNKGAMTGFSFSKLFGLLPKVFAGFVVLCYLFLGFYVIFGNTHLAEFNPLLKNIFGGIMVLYGVYKGYMFYVKYYDGSNEKDA